MIESTDPEDMFVAWWDMDDLIQVIADKRLPDFGENIARTAWMQQQKTIEIQQTVIDQQTLTLRKYRTVLKQLQELQDGSI